MHLDRNKFFFLIFCFGLNRWGVEQKWPWPIGAEIDSLGSESALMEQRAVQGPSVPTEVLQEQALSKDLLESSKDAICRRPTRDAPHVAWKPAADRVCP